MKNVSLLKIGIDFKCHHTDCTSSLTAYGKAALENVQAKKISWWGTRNGLRAGTLSKEAASGNDALTCIRDRDRCP